MKAEKLDCWADASTPRTASAYLRTYIDALLVLPVFTLNY